MKLGHCYNRLIVLIFLVAFNYCGLLYASGQVKPHENDSQFSKNLTSSYDLFECPTVHIDSMLKLNSKIESGTLNQLEYFLDLGELSPFIGSPTPLHKKYLTYIEPFLKRFFGAAEAPEKLRLIQTPAIQPLSALYCRGLQGHPHELTILISPDVSTNIEDLLKIIVHEFTHHYFYMHKISEPTWLEEGTALLSGYIFSGQPSGSAIIEHFQKPWASFFKDIDNPKLSLSAYGEAQLFFMYLYNFLGDDLLINLLNPEGFGVEAIEHIIRSAKKSPWRSFQDAFRDFQIAKYINRQDPLADNDIDQRRYFIFQSTLHAKPGLKTRTSGECYQIKNSEFEQIQIKKINNPMEVMPASDNSFNVCIE